MDSRKWLFGLATIARVAAEQGKLLITSPGEGAVIPHWDIASSTSPGIEDIVELSKPGAADTDSKAWTHIPISKCTLMACLIEAGVYSDEDLWFSENLKDFNWGQFSVPWVYRNEFALEPEDGKHFLLQTNGITSRGDIYLNGELIADKDYQSGSYSGHEYEITDFVGEENALLIQTYPTNYYTDLALGFIDWNPVPPDNGTGIWRDVTIKQTGPVSLGPLRALVDIDPGKVTLRATAKNLEEKEITITATAAISEAGDGPQHALEQTVTLGPGEARVIEFNQTFDDPQIWWPKQWGEQPLYSAYVSASANNATSDAVTRSFGLRTVTSEVNENDDRVFSVNNHPFQVIGGGYSADMFLRFDPERFETIVKYMLDIGLNTIRLEGNNEHPELYEITDRLGLMVMAGWECCNKWESWEYNEELAVDPPDYWDEQDYSDANATMWHETQMIQTHPSMLAYLIGSDFWPNDKATEIYVNALRGGDWEVPIVGAASKRGYPELLGRGGMKMEGPYDWVPPNYWYDVEPAEDRYGAAFGFGSELGAGVGTPEIGSLKRFLTEEDLEDLWKQPNKGLYHMSTNISQFYDRSIYNEGLFKRYGEPSSLEDYLRKAQIMDYEAIRAEHEAFSAHWSTGRIGTGMIYWMLVNAWPSLHWNQFDNYLHPAGTYFGSKVGSRLEHVSYNYEKKDVWLINHSLHRSGTRSIDVEVINLDGSEVARTSFDVETEPNASKQVDAVPGLDETSDVVFVRLVLRDQDGKSLSRNVYWVAPEIDELDWANSTWYHTPVTKFADYTSLFGMDEAKVKSSASAKQEDSAVWTVTLENESEVPAFFIRLNLVDEDGNDVNPVTWSDNYITLWPKETLELTLDGWGRGASVQLDGSNVAASTVSLEA